ncbi:MAG: FtsX-like permease family protein [Emergencia timonensis]
MGVWRRAFYNLKTESRRYWYLFMTLFAASFVVIGVLKVRQNSLVLSNDTARTIIVLSAGIAALILALQLRRTLLNRDYEIRILRSMGVDWIFLLAQFSMELMVPLVMAALSGCLIGGALTSAVFQKQLQGQITGFQSITMGIRGREFWTVLGIDFCAAVVAIMIMALRVKEYLPKKLKVKK